ncbi:MAG: formate--tetrahydrofolate ligase, partial [Deltaproteobacteria bacterium]|nr:formate--tetrahydrofolate ligase [Deltaproteobacteria bacterium]
MAESDIEIARKSVLKPIAEIGDRLGVPREALLPYGHTKAKIDLSYVGSLFDRENGKLVVVTAVTPTPAGEGKTTTSVGLADGLNR